MWLWVVVLCAIVLTFKSLPWCANHTDSIGYIYARMFIGLQERCGVMLVRKCLNVATNNTGAQTFIGSYGRWFHHVMALDRYRMAAYLQGIRDETHVGARVWLDVGTGAHMPLARALLDASVDDVTHVHATEANAATYRAAAKLRHNLSPLDRARVTLHHGYSAELDVGLRPQPTAVIHEIVGTVASSEGAVHAMRAAFRVFPTLTKMVPHILSTLCVPVSQPAISLPSVLASLIFGGSVRIATNTVGVQRLYNPPRALWMARPVIVEQYGLEDMRCAPTSNDVRRRADMVAITRAAHCSGLFFAPRILCSADSASVIDGLKHITNWGVEYLSFGEHGRYLNVGDALHLAFTAEVGSECPTYTVQVSCNTLSPPLRVRHTWRGPQDNMLI